MNFKFSLSDSWKLTAFVSTKIGERTIEFYQFQNHLFIKYYCTICEGNNNEIIELRNGTEDKFSELLVKFKEKLSSVQLLDCKRQIKEIEHVVRKKKFHIVLWHKQEKSYFIDMGIHKSLDDTRAARSICGYIRTKNILDRDNKRIDIKNFSIEAKEMNNELVNQIN